MVPCMAAALFLEKPSPERLAVMAGNMAILIIWMHLREFRPGGLNRLLRFNYARQKVSPGGGANGLIPVVFYLVDVALLFTLEQNSRFILNYYLHFLYFVLLVNAGVNLPKVHGLAVNAMTFVLSMVKFVQLLAVNNTPFNFSAAMFSFFTGILTMLIISYAKTMFQEKEKVEMLYGELKQYASRVRELSVAGERNRIAGELHDIIGHSLTALVMELEICARIMAEDPRKAHDIVKRAIEYARSALVNVRRAVDALRPGELEKKDLRSALVGLVEEFSVSCGVAVELDLKAVGDFSPMAELALFRAVQEALTNSLRHGRATAIKIDTVTYSDSTVIKICDNGAGDANSIPGHGLKGMRDRVETAGGRVTYGPGENGGFTVEIRLPNDDGNKKALEASARG